MFMIFCSVPWTDTYWFDGGMCTQHCHPYGCCDMVGSNMYEKERVRILLGFHE